MSDNRLEHFQRFYYYMDVLEDKVGGKRILAECHGRMYWPKRGVYFFFEPDESRTTSGEGLRVVRVGTHALNRRAKNELWVRLRQHRGNLVDGGGNHRSSIFRLHLGTAIINRDDLGEPFTTTWGVDSSASRDIRKVEKPLEQAVSQQIRKMPFLWVKVNDEPGPDSDRGVIECNTISLHSNYCAVHNSTLPIDPPSENWLGRYAKNDAIRQSGLWNVNHVRECYDPTFLDLLEGYIKAM